MSKETPVQPTLADLMARYLQKQADAHAAGLGMYDPSGEVVPFEAGPVQPVDPRPAWEEALTVVPGLRAGVDSRSWQAPPQWPQLVAGQEPVVALAFCVGNFPQMMRNFHLVLHRGKLAEMRPTAGRPIALPGLSDWANQAAKKRFPHTILALGVLRLARQFDEAREWVSKHDAEVPAEWQAVWANEKAALAWHEGRADEAYRMWQALPASVPVLFNRGMAALFLERTEEARIALSSAVAQLPESGAWHHLGRLYLTLAETRK